MAMQGYAGCLRALTEKVLQKGEKVLRGLRKYLTPFAPDRSGAVSVLYELWRDQS